MKRICKYCFNFVDRSYKICPICHRNVNGKSSERVDDLNNNDTKKVVLTEPAEDKNIDINAKHKIKWIPPKKRDGYLDQKEKKNGKNIRVQGRHIDVSEISMFEGKYKNNYQPKQAGTENDYKLEKLQWWEIYRKADRWLIRRKLNKVVKKQACVKPARVSQMLMVILSLFTGFLGLHDFYAKNFKRGAITLGCFAWSMTLVALMDVWPWLINVQYSLIALPGLVCIMMWMWDFFEVITKRYPYQESRLDFIYSLDVETRARLGNKYIYVPNWYEYKG